MLLSQILNIPFCNMRNVEQESSERLDENKWNGYFGFCFYFLSIFFWYFSHCLHDLGDGLTNGINNEVNKKM